MSDNKDSGNEQFTPEELVERWRRLSHQRGLHQRETFNARCEIYAKCADELERSLDTGTEQ